ncbi:LAQU0S01e00210g1_1 [Lachancea quebecensis]|uniref:LAQU0S01e00210g1_1 n=1 Tax=Lachancea quebecensis TaxID=1654605 RepID=A0A0P1KLJ1_9SACH|nr:LAQU0S01e00210g1_1 [Lachancea quebecensis]
MLARPLSSIESLTRACTMITAQQRNDLITPATGSVASPAAWYSSTAFLAAVRLVQFASSITALGLLAYIVDYTGGAGFQIAVSAISLTYLIVVASATLPLNLYALVAIFVFETAIFALWVATSATLGSHYRQYTCTVYAPQGDSSLYYGYQNYFNALNKECKVGKASTAFAAFSAFLSLCALCLLWVNVLAPMNAGFFNGTRPDGATTHLRRFTALAIARAPAAGEDVEADPVTAEESVPVTDEDTAPVTAET